MKWIAGCLVILAGLIALYASAYMPETVPYYRRIMQQEISRHMRDPASTQFRDLLVGKSVSGRALCGELNSKNALGGYTGFGRFIYERGSDQLTFADEQLPITQQDLKQSLLACADSLASQYKEGLANSGVRTEECLRDDDIKLHFKVQQLFQELWRRKCGA